MAKRRTSQAKQPVFVLDGSVTMAWYFVDEATPYTDAVRAGLRRVTAIVPALRPYEVANVLAVGERRNRSTSAQANAWVPLLLSLPIQVESTTSVQVLNVVLSLARSHTLTVYDAAYLELAIRRGLPLATLDEKLRTATSAVGVTLYVP